MTAAYPVLPFAAFLGNIRGACEWDGFSFCQVVDRADQEIPRHTHQEAHFFLLLRGSYITEARPAGGICAPSTLIFNPRWTTHRDRFRTRGGCFFTISIRPDILTHVADDSRLVHGATAVDAPQCKAIAYRIYNEFRSHGAPSLNPQLVRRLGFIQESAVRIAEDRKGSERFLTAGRHGFRAVACSKQP